MPRVGPGDDNVTGDRYTMDLGVEPDLGNLLQNLQVANDYLDQAEQRLRTINDVVGNSTQRLAAMTRQTQLLAAETARLENSYASIASSTMGMANMASMPGPPMPGMAMGGMGGYGGYAGYGYGGPNMGAPQGNVVQTMSSGGFDENRSEFSPQSTVGPPRLPSMRFTELEQGKELFSSLFGKPRSGSFTGRFAAGWKNKSYRKDYQPDGLDPTLPDPGRSDAPIDSNNWPTLPSPPLTDYPPDFVPPDIGLPAAPVGAGMVEGGLGTMGWIKGLNAQGGAAGVIGGVAGRFGPYALIAEQVAKRLYDSWAGAEAESRRIAGLTGGEAGIAGMIGNENVPGSLSLSTRARFMNLVHPGVDYGEIQERTLEAGYVGGEYGQARDYLFEAYKRGLGTTIDQIDLYTEAVDKSGASTQQLTGSMDQLRSVASTTNVSISSLMQNMQAQVESLTGMGFSGGAAVSQATQGAQAFAMDPYATLNPNLRQAGGYSLTSPFMQVQAANQLGVPLGSLAPTLAANPGINANVLGENAAIEMLTRLGFTEQMDASPGGAMDQFISSRGWGGFMPDGTTILGSILGQLQILPSNLTNADYATIKTWIWTTINRHPMQRQADAQHRAVEGGDLADRGERAMSAMKGSAISAQRFVSGETGGFWGGLVSGFVNAIPGGPAIAPAIGITAGAREATQSNAENYVQDVLGLNTGGVDHPLGDQLLGYFGRDDAQTSPVLEKILQGAGSPENTYVKTQDGRIVRLDEWMKNGPADWQQALEDGRVQIAHADAATQERIAKDMGGRTRGIENSDAFASGAIQFNTTEEEMNAIGPTIRGQRGVARGDNVVAIDDVTLQRMAEFIGREVNNG